MKLISNHIVHPYRIAIITKATKRTYEVKKICSALETLGVEVAIYHPDGFAIQIGAHSEITYNGGSFVAPNLVLARTGAGTGPRAMILLRELERLGVIVVNKLDAILKALDKVHTMQLAAADGLTIPQTVVLSPKHRPAVDGGQYPRILKPATGSKGRGVIRVDTLGAMKAQLDLVKTLAPNRTFIMQEYLGDQPGTDVRVLVIDSKAIAAMKRWSTDGDDRANYSAGGVVEEYPLNPVVTMISERMANLCGLSIAGVDLLFVKDSFAVCEINSSPGFEGMDKATGLDIGSKIATYLMQRMTCC